MENIYTFIYLFFKYQLINIVPILTLYLFIHLSFEYQLINIVLILIHIGFSYMNFGKLFMSFLCVKLF